MKNLNDIIKPILGLVVIVLSFGYLYLCTFTATKADPAITVFMVSASGLVLNYYLGSSSGSSKKDDTISDALSNSAVPPYTPVITK